MSAVRVPSRREVDALETFRDGLDQDMSQLPTRMTRIAGAPEGGHSASARESDEAERTDVMNALSSELYALLRKYIVLLERNGGWSLHDEQDVETVLWTLVRSGWTISRSEHGELGGIAVSVRAAPPARGMAGRPFYDSTDHFQWTRDSSPNSEPHS